MTRWRGIDIKVALATDAQRPDDDKTQQFQFGQIACRMILKISQEVVARVRIPCTLSFSLFFEWFHLLFFLFSMFGRGFFSFFFLCLSSVSELLFLSVFALHQKQ